MSDVLTWSDKFNEVVTEDAILTAYRETGLKPVFEKYGDGVTCGCALTALIKHKKPDAFDEVIAEGISLNDWMSGTRIHEFLGIQPSYAIAFIDGFDSTWSIHEWEKTGHPRILRGKQVRDKVIAEFGIKRFIGQDDSEEDEN